DKHHYNQSVLLNRKEGISEEGIRAVLAEIVSHHDALRMVFRQTAGGWIQENRGKEMGYHLEVLPITDEETFRRTCDSIQSGIDLQNGPLFKAVLFRGQAGDRLLLVAHHLVVDGVSWRILFEDLSLLYEQYLSGQAPALSFKTDSFRHWQERQLSYAQSGVLHKEEAYWAAIEQAAPDHLKPDDPGGSNLVKDGASYTWWLDESATH